MPKLSLTKTMVIAPKAQEATETSTPIITPEPLYTPSNAPQVMRKGLWIPEEIDSLIHSHRPQTKLGRLIRLACRYLPHPEMAATILEELSKVVIIGSSLDVRVMRASGAFENYGRVSEKVITSAGVDFLVDNFQGLKDLDQFKYHGLGESSTAESTAQTALGSELSTEYATDNTRPTGTQTEGATANIYRTVGTATVDGACDIEEHGIFDQEATGGGTMWDRSLTGTVSLVSGDTFVGQYEVTATAGG